MFVSLNKKIIYSILFFFIISSLIFIYTFYIVYGNRIQEELRSNIQRNQQYIDLLYQNINLSNELRNAIRQNKSASITADTKSDAIFGENENSLLKQIHNEQRRIAEFNKNYDERYAAIQESVKILGISSIIDSVPTKPVPIRSRVPSRSHSRLPSTRALSASGTNPYSRGTTLAACLYGVGFSPW